MKIDQTPSCRINPLPSVIFLKLHKEFKQLSPRNIWSHSSAKQIHNVNLCELQSGNWLETKIENANYFLSKHEIDKSKQTNTSEKEKLKSKEKKFKNIIYLKIMINESETWEI